MSWRDALRTASFRGVPFHYLDTSLEGGRRAVLHEFPLRDTPSSEDLGCRAKRFSIRAYVDGDGYMAARDALQTALDAAGPGTLVHPYRGNISVQIDKYRLSELNERGRYAAFDIECFESGTQPSPVSTTDTAGAVKSASAGAKAAISSSFKKSWSLTGFAENVAASAKALVGQAQGAMNGLLAVPQAVMTEAQNALLDFAVDISDAEGIARSVTGFFDAFEGDLALDAFIFDDTLSSRGPDAPGDPGFGLAGMCAWGETLATPAAATTPALAAIADNQAALAALVQGVAACTLADIYASTDFISEDAADAAREQLGGILDDLMLAASDAGDDESVAAFAALASAVASDLTTRGKKLPNVVTYEFGTPLPALALAEFIYGDASRAGELIARNDAPHPLFMPRAVQALSP